MIFNTFKRSKIEEKNFSRLNCLYWLVQFFLMVVVLYLGLTERLMVFSLGAAEEFSEIECHFGR